MFLRFTAVPKEEVINTSTVTNFQRSRTSHLAGASRGIFFPGSQVAGACPGELFSDFAVRGRLPPEGFFQRARSSQAFRPKEFFPATSRVAGALPDYFIFEVRGLRVLARFFSKKTLITTTTYHFLFGTAVRKFHASNPILFLTGPVAKTASCNHKQ